MTRFSPVVLLVGVSLMFKVDMTVLVMTDSTLQRTPLELSIGPGIDWFIRPGITGATLYSLMWILLCCLTSRIIVPRNLPWRISHRRICVLPIAASAGRAGDGSVPFVSPLDKGKSPFKNDTMPRNPYSAQIGYDGYSRHRAKEDEEDEFLGGEIISPRNADRR